MRRRFSLRGPTCSSRKSMQDGEECAGAKGEEKASACCVRNDVAGVGSADPGREMIGDGRVRALLHSKFGGPLSGGVEDAEDFEGVGADAVGDDVGSVGDDEFAGAGDAAGAAH
jgi:hypothetical protein